MLKDFVICNILVVATITKFHILETFLRKTKTKTNFSPEFSDFQCIINIVVPV